MAITALTGGPLTSFIGYYSPVLMLGSVSAAVAVGLISTFTPDTGAGEWISYYGIGTGMAFQPPFIAVQTVLDDSTVPTALVLLSFTQIFGGIVVLSITQNVFLNRLTKSTRTRPELSIE